MATINIGGRRVAVDDGFLSLSPEQQQAAVEEIASSLPAAPSNSRAEGAAASAIPGDEAMSGGGLEAALIGARQGVTLGFGDEINAGVRAAGDWVGGKLGMSEPTSIGDAYDTRLKHERDLLRQTRSENPASTTVGEIAGGVMLPAGGAASGANLMAQVGRGAIAGAAGGAAYGFGEGEGGLANRARGAAVGGAVGGAVGAAAPFVVRGVGNALASRSADDTLGAVAKSAPGVEDLRAASGDLYRAAEARGVAIKKSSFAPLVADIAASTRDMGIDRDLTPRSVAALRRLTEAVDEGGDSISWRDLETLRRVTSIASTAKDPADRRVAGAIVGKVDDFVMNLMDEDLSAGAADGMSAELKQARSLWKQMRGSERLAGAIESAKDAASGFENGMRIEFRKLIRDRKFFGSLSKTEQDAVRQVVHGTTVGNILKRVSRLSYGTGAQTNFLGASVAGGMGATAGHAVAGPVGAVIGATAPALVGRAAGNAAERATLGAAQRAQGLISAGPETVTNALSGMAPPDMFTLNNALARARMGVPAGIMGQWSQPTPVR
jgi:hypothetical protein